MGNFQYIKDFTNSIKYRLKSNVVVSALKVHFGICNA